LFLTVAVYNSEMPTILRIGSYRFFFYSNEMGKRLTWPYYTPNPAPGQHLTLAITRCLPNRHLY